MSQLSALAPAKVNLTLQLTGLRADGYHLLDSAVVFAEIGDRLSVTAAPDLVLSVDGPRAAGVPVDGRNLVMQAAERLRALRGVTVGAAITLTKHLPHGGGIGGGSSDAAVAIRLLSELWGVAPLSAAEALPLGADVPVCLAGPGPQRMRGIGERLEPLPAPLPEAWLVLVNPGVERATPEMFRAHDARAGAVARPDHRPWAGGDLAALAAWITAHGNDFTRLLTEDGSPVHLPQIAEILSGLEGAEGCLASGLSGSGSTCWGLFGTRAAAEAASGALRVGVWWVASGAILTA